MSELYTIVEIFKTAGNIIEIPVGFFSNEMERDDAFKKYFYFVDNLKTISEEAFSQGRWARKGTMKGY